MEPNVGEACDSKTNDRGLVKISSAKGQQRNWQVLTINSKAFVQARIEF